MPRLLYFNPENDLALAANDPHYTPPASALRMATDLQLLPLHWAAPDDLILLRKDPPPTPPVREGSGLREEMFLKVEEPSTLRSTSGRFETSKNPQPSARPLVASKPRRTLSPPPSPLPNGRGRGWVCLPWGWSPLTVTDFLRAGVPASLLPTPDQMQAFRTVAGRATAAEVLRRLRERLTAEGFGDLLTGEAHVCHSLDEARHWHERFGESMFKQPWSGSGRGLLPAHDGQLTPKNEAWLQRTLRQQGYVMAEPLYRRRLDFALEFWRHADGTVTYEGLSLFMTTAGGVYAGNIVDTEERKLHRLLAAAPHLAPLLVPQGDDSCFKFQVSGSKFQVSGFNPHSSFGIRHSSFGIHHSSFVIHHSSFLIQALITELSALPPTFYEGPIGVDMMICQAPPSSLIPHPSSLFLLHPCVEINFRMTMGWLALHVKP